MELYRLVIFFTLFFSLQIAAQIDAVESDQNMEDIRLQIEVLEDSNVDKIISLSNILYKTKLLLTL